MVEIDQSCCCGSIGAPPDDVRCCVFDHRYWRGDKELVSVSKVLRSTWPFKTDFSQAPEHILENARDRGVVVDTDLITPYLSGRLSFIPKGTRKDAIELFFKFKRWWEDHKHGEVRTQVILADDSVAGTCDILDDETIWDVKTTYNVEPMYSIQLGAYGALHYTTFKKPVKQVGIIHLTERFPSPKIVKLNTAEVIQDWLLIKDAYFMACRRTGK